MMQDFRDDDFSSDACKISFGLQDLASNFLTYYYFVKFSGRIWF